MRFILYTLCILFVFTTALGIYNAIRSGYYGLWISAAIFALISYGFWKWARKKPANRVLLSDFAEAKKAE